MTPDIFENRPSFLVRNHEMPVFHMCIIFGNKPRDRVLAAARPLTGKTL